MAEHGKDATDLWLESVLASESVPEDGFSERIVRRIRRRTRIRRWALGTAVVVGTIVAAGPALELLTFLYRLLGQLSGTLAGSPADAVPSLDMLLAGGVLFMAAVLGLRFLED